MNRLTRLFSAIATLAFALTACTSTFSDADLEKEGLRENTAAHGEMIEEIGVIEEGGVNNTAIDEEAESVDRERDL